MSDDDEDTAEAPDTVFNHVDGHWYVVTYGVAPYQIHAPDCDHLRGGVRRHYVVTDSALLAGTDSSSVPAATDSSVRPMPPIHCHMT